MTVLFTRQGGTGTDSLTGVVLGTGTNPLTAVALPADATMFLDGTGNFSTPGGSSGPITIENTSSLFSTGLGAGSSSTAVESVFLGYLTGQNATNASDSVFLGYGAGFGSTDAYSSQFIGQSAGYSAPNARVSVFIGDGTGAVATDAHDSNFIGGSAGSAAANASFSNFFGSVSGYQATNASFSNFFGNYAGNGATNATHSQFIGYGAGNAATDASNSIFIGQYAGSNDTFSGTTTVTYNTLAGGTFSPGPATINSDDVIIVSDNGSNSMVVRALYPLYAGLTIEQGSVTATTVTIVEKWSILIGNYINTGGFSGSILLGSPTDDLIISNTKNNQFMLAPSITETQWRGIDYTFPSAQALGSGYVLSNNGSGVLSWAAASAGTVTSVTGTTNRITSTGGTTPVIDISVSYVGQSSITTLGTIGTGIWQGTVVAGQYGGTGVNNSGKTITLAGNLVTTGAFNTTFAASATATYTLPTATSTLLANNLGLAGGTTLIGGAANGENLRLSSTNSGTKGSILFGISSYDESLNTLGIGTIANSVNNISVKGVAAAGTRVAVYNSGTTSTDFADFDFYTSAGSIHGAFRANSALNVGYGGASSINFVNVLNAPLSFATNNLVRFLIDGQGLGVFGTSSVTTGKLGIIDTVLAGSGSLNGELLNLQQTWNTSGAPTAIKLNVTNTASGAAALLQDLQIGGVSQFSVSKAGLVSSLSGYTTVGNTNYTIQGSGGSFIGNTLQTTGTNQGLNLTTTGTGQVNINTSSNNSSTDMIGLRIASVFNPNAGTNTFTFLNIAGTISQTGSATGITRGLYVNPTLTSADFRAIESANGKVVFADTISSGSGSLAGSLLNMTQTWNTSGTPTAVKLNVTDTASNAASLLMDLQVGGVSKYSVSKAGNGLFAGTLGVTGVTTLATTLTGPLRADSGVVSVDATIVAGTYTPTATNVTNITSSTPIISTYSRVGNIVTVSGTITVTETLAVASQVDISLPVASNLAAATDLNGVATMDSTASVNMYIKGDATNDRASIFFTAAGVGQTSTIYFTFQYKII